jgi:hypothetical protein
VRNPARAALLSPAAHSGSRPLTVTACWPPLARRTAKHDRTASRAEGLWRAQVSASAPCPCARVAKPCKSLESRLRRRVTGRRWTVTVTATPQCLNFGATWGSLQQVHACVYPQEDVPHVDVDGNTVLLTFGFSPEGLWANVAMLAIQCGAFLGLTFLLLRHRSRP